MNAVEKALQQANEVLKPCPFCGGAALVKPTEIWLTEFYFVKCGKCHSRGNLFSVGLHPHTKEVVTSQKAIQEAVKAWNKTYIRADETPIRAAAE